MKLEKNSEEQEKMREITKTSEFKPKKPKQTGKSKKVNTATSFNSAKRNEEIKQKNDKKKKEEKSLIVEFSVKVKKDDIEKNFDEALNRYASDIKLPGFRKGKVPLAIVKTRFKDTIIDEVKNKMVEEAVLTKIKNEKMRIISTPTVKKITYAEGKDLEAAVRVEVFPEVKLPELSTIEVEISAKELKIEPYDEVKTIDLMLQSSQRQAPVVDRKIKDKDVVLLKIQSKVLKTKRLTPKQRANFNVNETESHDILELYKEIIGKEKGDKIVFKRKYPADYKKKIWSEKEIEHHIEVENIFELVKPKLDEAFLKSMGFKEEKYFRKKLEDEYTEAKDKNIEDKKIESIIKKLNKIVDFPLPQSIVEQETARLIHQNQYQLKSKNEKDIKDFLSTMKKSAEDSVRFSFIIEAVKNESKLSVGNDDLEKEYTFVAEASKVDVKEIRRYYMKPEYLEQLKEAILKRKVIDLLKEKIKIKEV